MGMVESLATLGWRTHRRSMAGAETVPARSSSCRTSEVVMRQFVVVLRILLIVAVLSANFGGGAQSVPARQTDPPQPVANAGPPSIIGEPGGLITLNGSASTGTGLSFQWRQIGGLTVTLNGANTPIATFIFPFVPGVALPVFTFELTV